MQRPPTEGVPASKPRFKPAGKASEITRQRVSELSEAYLEARNSKLRSQAFLAEAQAKEKAGELISRELVTLQAQSFACGNRSSTFPRNTLAAWSA